MLGMLVGQKGKLVYLSDQAGVDQADISTIEWQQQSGGANVKFTAPDLVEAIAPGLANMRCRVTFVGGAQYPYKFQIESRQTEASALAAPVMIQPL